jgi:hypothetical protein
VIILFFSISTDFAVFNANAGWHIWSSL